jgi:hypothetical protein
MRILVNLDKILILEDLNIRLQIRIWRLMQSPATRLPLASRDCLLNA